jgi:hypothetical protein
LLLTLWRHAVEAWPFSGVKWVGREKYLHRFSDEESETQKPKSSDSCSFPADASTI